MPWKISPGKQVPLLISILISAITAMLGVYNLLRGNLTIGVFFLLMCGSSLVLLVGRQLKNYDRFFVVVGGTIIVIVTVIMAFAVQNLYLQVIMFLLACVWSFFLLLGTYNLFIKNLQPRIL